jgi:DNA modification methylase
MLHSRIPIGDWVVSRLAKLGKNDLTRQNSANASGFGRDISKWVGKETALPSNVISIALVGENKGHPAVFPVDLPLFFIKLLCPEDGLVIDPFAGSGTTGIAALALGRKCALIDNDARYCELAHQRLREEGLARGTELRRKHSVKNKQNEGYPRDDSVRQLVLIKESGKKWKTRKRS